MSKYNFVEKGKIMLNIFRRKVELKTPIIVYELKPGAHYAIEINKSCVSRQDCAHLVDNLQRSNIDLHPIFVEGTPAIRFVPSTTGSEEII